MIKMQFELNTLMFDGDPDPPARGGGVGEYSAHCGPSTYLKID